MSNDERVAELESLLEFLGPAITALDEVTAKAAEPAERLRKLLQAQDKRETLLEMAGGAWPHWTGIGGALCGRACTTVCLPADPVLCPMACTHPHA